MDLKLGITDEIIGIKNDARDDYVKALGNATTNQDITIAKCCFNLHIHLFQLNPVYAYPNIRILSSICWRLVTYLLCSGILISASLQDNIRNAIIIYLSLEVVMDYLYFCCVIYKHHRKDVTCLTSLHQLLDVTTAFLILFNYDPIWNATIILCVFQIVYFFILYFILPKYVIYNCYSVVGSLVYRTGLCVVSILYVVTDKMEAVIATVAILCLISVVAKIILCILLYIVWLKDISLTYKKAKLSKWLIQLMFVQFYTKNSYLKGISVLLDIFEQVSIVLNLIAFWIGTDNIKIQIVLIAAIALHFLFYLGTTTFIDRGQGERGGNAYRCLFNIEIPPKSPDPLPIQTSPNQGQPENNQSPNRSPGEGQFFPTERARLHEPTNVHLDLGNSPNTNQTQYRSNSNNDPSNDGENNATNLKDVKVSELPNVEPEEINYDNYT